MSEIAQKITDLEAQMAEIDFWNDKDKAQASLRELHSLKEELAEKDKYNRGPAIITIFSGAGGDDSENFSAMLFSMYEKYAARVGWELYRIHENENDHGGYRNITFEIRGKGAYGRLKKESGVHRLVRVSPFSAKKQRHTSFSLVEVIPKFETVEFDIPESELRIEFARSSGPGGQNVNKRETAVRVVHIPTNLSAHSEAERSQQANREKALMILRGKLYKLAEEDRLKKEAGMQISKTTSIEWGNQIRSYVLHPYKMVKDHRTEVETSDVESVLAGEIDPFLDAEQGL